jgi:hypothetical protein
VHRLSELFCLYAARAARGFGDGFAAIILTAYLIELGFTPFQGWRCRHAPLLGSAVLTLGIGTRHQAQRRPILYATPTGLNLR